MGKGNGSRLIANICVRKTFPFAYIFVESTFTWKRPNPYLKIMYMNALVHATAQCFDRKDVAPWISKARKALSSSSECHQVLTKRHASLRQHCHPPRKNPTITWVICYLLTRSQHSKKEHSRHCMHPTLAREYQKKSKQALFSKRPLTKRFANGNIKSGTLLSQFTILFAAKM